MNIEGESGMFRKRPIVIQAERATERTVIHTLEGDMTAEPGDWIITGVKGEKYPCKPDIFEATYERADATPGPLSAEDATVLAELEIWSVKSPYIRNKLDYLRGRLSSKPAPPTSEERTILHTELKSLVERRDSDFHSRHGIVPLESTHLIWHERMEKLKALILSAPAPVKVSREWYVELAKAFWDKNGVLAINLLAEKGIVVEPEKGEPR